MNITSLPSTQRNAHKLQSMHKNFVLLALPLSIPMGIKFLVSRQDLRRVHRWSMILPSKMIPKSLGLTSFLLCFPLLFVLDVSGIAQAAQCAHCHEDDA